MLIHLYRLANFLSIYHIPILPKLIYYLQLLLSDKTCKYQKRMVRPLILRWSNLLF